MKAINPATGDVFQEYKEMTDDEVKAILVDVNATYEGWRGTEFSHRAGLMRKAAEILRQRSRKYAELITREMGKPVMEAVAEVEKCAWVCDFYADNAEAFLADEPVETDATRSYVSYQPQGIVLAVMPWNFPFWQVWRFVAPALMAGNAGVLKHASNVPGSALAIEEVVRDAGFPPNLFRTLLIGSNKVAAVIENPHVKAVTLTGSTPAGRAVAGKAGQMLKKSVLELGGSDPYVVLADADIEESVLTCVRARLINAGQSCIAGKRFIVEEPVHDRFTELFVETMRMQKMGDPMSEDTMVGPMARHDLRDELHDQVTRSVDAGAKLLLGGEIPVDRGAYYPPTVLGDVRRGMPAFDEELFGPVAAIIRAKDENEAVELANATVFGLGSSVFTADVEKGERIAKYELQAGSSFVNAFVRSDPRLPFGGVKESGYGRELAAFGIREFVNVKTVYIR